MSSEDSELPQVTLTNSAEYHRRFKLSEDLQVLTSTAKDIIQENVEQLHKASKRSRLDLLLFAMLDHAPSDDGKRYSAIVIQMAQEHGPQEVISVAETWERYLCMKSELFVGLDIHCSLTVYKC